MAACAVTVPLLKTVLVVTSFQPAPAVASWLIAAKTARELTGRPATSSIASPKPTGHLIVRMHYK